MYRTKTMLILMVITCLVGVGLTAAAIHSAGKPHMAVEAPHAHPGP